jgi:alpha-beta hydrolase superfamily lysophospholipase
VHVARFIDELRVDVYESDGPPRSRLLLSHGLWVGGWIWEDFAKYLAARGYECYAPTWRGRYDSAPTDDVGKLTVDNFVDDLLNVYREVGAQVIIGESAGGLFAMKAAEHLSPSELNGLVLMNPAPPFMVPVSPNVLSRQIKYLPDLLFGKPNLPSEKDYKALILNNVPELEASEFYAKICADSGKAISQMSMGRIKIDARRIQCPVYVVIGHLDAILPVKVHRRIAEILGAEIAEYPNMSHHTFSEEGWEKVADELIAWLASKTAAFAGE